MSDQLDDVPMTRREKWTCVVFGVIALAFVAWVIVDSVSSSANYKPRGIDDRDLAPPVVFHGFF